MSTKIITSTEVRLSYENLLTARVQNEGDEPTYSTMVLIPKSDTETVEAIKAAMKAAADDGIARKWNGKKPSGLRNPLRDGDVEREDDPNAKGMWFLNAKGPRGGLEPAFLYAKNGRQISASDPDAPSVIYSGVYGRISLNFYPYDRNGNRGVAAGIVAFLSSEHGERLDSKPTANSALAEFGIDPLSAPASAKSGTEGTGGEDSNGGGETVVESGNTDDDPWG